MHSVAVVSFDVTVYMVLPNPFEIFPAVGLRKFSRPTLCHPFVCSLLGTVLPLGDFAPSHPVEKFRFGCWDLSRSSFQRAVTPTPFVCLIQNGTYPTLAENRARSACCAVV